MSRLVRLASLLGTQTLSPLARVLTRVILISLSGAKLSRLPPRNRTPRESLRQMKSEALQLARPSGETKCPVLCSRGKISLGGEHADQGRSFQGCNKREPSPKTAQILNSRRANTHVPWPGTCTASTVSPPLCPSADRQPIARRRFRSRNS